MKNNTVSRESFDTAIEVLDANDAMLSNSIEKCVEVITKMQIRIEQMAIEIRELKTGHIPVPVPVPVPVVEDVPVSRPVSSTSVKVKARALDLSAIESDSVPSSVPSSDTFEQAYADTLAIIKKRMKSKNPTINANIARVLPESPRRFLAMPENKRIKSLAKANNLNAVIVDSMLMSDLA